jgi:putative hydrolase
VGVDAIYVADHQVPLADGPNHPRDVRARLERGDLTTEEVVGSLVGSTAKALDRAEAVVIAHFLSILPKLGLDEADVPADLLDALAAETARTGQRIEISERWRCPSAATLRPFARHGVAILLSTDSHRRETIGRYDYCLAVLGELEAPLAGV